jgi:hypothetical protein
MEPDPPVTNTVLIAVAVRLRGLARMLAHSDRRGNRLEGRSTVGRSPRASRRRLCSDRARENGVATLHGAKKEAACVSTAASSLGRKRPKRAYAASGAA